MCVVLCFDVRCYIYIYIYRERERERLLLSYLARIRFFLLFHVCNYERTVDLHLYVLCLYLLNFSHPAYHAQLVGCSLMNKCFVATELADGGSLFDFLHSADLQVCMYVYVCVCMCMYVCMYVCVCVYVSAGLCKYLYVYM